MNPEAFSFGLWLSATVDGYALNIQPSSYSRRSGTWSERLATAMGEGIEYDSYLRRVAKGAIVPRYQTTYRIGDGLRSAGVAWCSGAYALGKNPKTFFDLLAIIDITSKSKLARDIANWFVFLLASKYANEDTLGERTYTNLMTVIASLTDHVNTELNDAFEQYQKHGLRKAQGFLGDAYLAARDHRYASGIAIARFAQGEWLRSNDINDDASQPALSFSFAENIIGPNFCKLVNKRLRDVCL